MGKRKKIKFLGLKFIQELFFKEELKLTIKISSPSTFTLKLDRAFDLSLLLLTSQNKILDENRIMQK